MISIITTMGSNSVVKYVGQDVVLICWFLQIWFSLFLLGLGALVSQMFVFGFCKCLCLDFASICVWVL